MLDAIPFEYASPQAPLIVIEGTLGENPENAQIVVDTGACAPFPVFISTAEARHLGLSLSKDVTPGTTTAIGAEPQTYKTGTLSSVRIGPMTLQKAEVAVVPMIDEMNQHTGRPIAAIIGYQFLRNQRILIDYQKRKIDFTAPAGADGDALPFVLAANKPIILVQTMVNGTGPFTFEIDTGATVTSLSPETAKRAQVRQTGEGRLAGAAGAVTVSRADANIRVGPIAFDLKNVSVTSGLTGLSAAAGTRVDGILGLDYLYRTRLTIDYPQSKVWISPPR